MNELNTFAHLIEQAACSYFIRKIYRLFPDVSIGFCGLHHVRGYMETPSGIKQAVIAILASLAINTLLALYQKLTDNASSALFICNIIIYALFCILPYKISNKSNAARYVYLVLYIVLMLSTFALDFEKYKLEFIVTFASIPIEIFIFYRLFQKEASDWFLSR